MNQTKDRDAKTVQDLAHRLKRDKAEYEAQIQALKVCVFGKTGVEFHKISYFMEKLNLNLLPSLMNSMVRDDTNF